MNDTNTLNVILSTLSTFGEKVLIIITATVGIGLAYLVFSYGWQRIKFSMSVREGMSDADDRPNFWKGERMGKRGSGHWSF